MDAQWQILASLLFLVGFSTTGSPAIGNGTTAGRLRTTASTVGRVGGVDFTKASTDNLWDLSAETNTTAGQFRAYWLYLTSAGVASIAAGGNAASADAALAALPTPDPTRSVFGVYVANASTDFDAAGGLQAQGTIHNGLPAGVPLSVRGKTYLPPAHLSLLAL